MEWLGRGCKSPSWVPDPGLVAGKQRSQGVIEKKATGSSTAVDSSGYSRMCVCVRVHLPVDIHTRIFVYTGNKGPLSLLCVLDYSSQYPGKRQCFLPR